MSRPTSGYTPTLFPRQIVALSAFLHKPFSQLLDQAQRRILMFSSTQTQPANFSRPIDSFLQA
jgi:hypothetical protein